MFAWVRIYFPLTKGTNIENGEKVAIKLESMSCRLPQLDIEARLYKELTGLQTGIFIVC
jgi:hypothetical protein